MLRFATYLAPSLYETYLYIARYVGAKVGHPTTLAVGQSLNEFAGAQVDVGFICGLPYVQMAGAPSCPVELLVSPILLGERYQNRPIYFSDVIVRRDSPYISFADLQGCLWAYNQKASHSGWYLVCYSLLERGKTLDYFGQLIETGSHQRSVSLVLEGQADATAIDSHVLDVFLARNRVEAAALRIIDMLGPSSIPPVVMKIRSRPAFCTPLQSTASYKSTTRITRIYGRYVREWKAPLLTRGFNNEPACQYLSDRPLDDVEDFVGGRVDEARGCV